MRRLIVAEIAVVFASLCSVPAAFPQAANNPTIDAPTTNGSVKITTGNTFQALLAAVPIVGGQPGTRHSLTIQNNNASDACYLIVGTNQVTPATTTLSTSITINGATVTAQQAAIVLTAGIPYQRYFPYVPSDAIYVTCATTGDSVYVDTQ